MWDVVLLKLIENSGFWAIGGASLTALAALLSILLKYHLDKRKSKSKNRYLLLKKLFELGLHFEDCIQEYNKHGDVSRHNWPDIVKFQNHCTNNLDSDMEMFLFHEQAELYSRILELRRLFYEANANMVEFRSLNLPDHEAMYVDPHGEDFRTELGKTLELFIRSSRKWCLGEFKFFVS